MRKCSLLLLVLLIIVSYGQVSASTVSLSTAQTIAANYFKVTVPSASGMALTPTLAYTESESDGTVDFYAFNMTPVTGFVIVSGDNSTTPILAYSAETNFTGTIPVYATINDWIKAAAARVHYIVSNNIPANTTVQSLWAAYGAGQNPNSLRTTTVGPLMATTWNQNPYYNSLCPPAADASTSSAKSVTGCVATAIAQVMKYWNYPPAGTGGTYSYADETSQGYQENYGTLSTNLDRPLYWANMPDNVTTNNSPVDTLMYEAGVSVDMDYSPNGSGAYVQYSEAGGAGQPCAQNSYLNYFYYNPGTMQGVFKSSYSNTGWVTLMKGEIDAGRVVQYEGEDPTQGGHTWIMDGYQSSSTATGGYLLHMNWGWGGYDDGYFDVTNLTTTNGGFDPSQDDGALIGILPLVKASVSTNPVCEGHATQLTVSTGYPTGVTYSWSPTTGLGCPTCVTTTASPTTNTTYTVTVSIAGLGTIGTASVAVDVSPLPSAPISVTLPAAPCTGATAAYTVPAVTGATSYTWTVSGTGWSGSSTTNSITLTAGSANATVSVTANNACGSSTPYTFTADHGAVPAAPASVTLPNTPCPSSTAVYTVGAVSGATSYTWTIGGTGWSGSSTTNSATLTAGSVAGTITVKADNSCGASTAYTFTAPVSSLPSAPASVILPNTPCPSSTAVYTVGAVSGATSYTWTVGGTGWSGSSTTNTATLTAGSVAGTITVKANNACGSGAAYTFHAPVSALPAAPTSVTLPAAPCPSSTAVYTVPAVTGAISYTWTVSGTGWSGSSTTHTATLTAGSVAGTVTVKANNACGSSAPYTFTAPVGTLPATPASVIQPGTLCAGTSGEYIVPAVAGATSYTWTVSGTGWSGSSTTDSITLTAGSGAASVSITANGSCGSSPAYVFTPTSNTLPSAATSISAPGLICSGQSVTLTTPAISGASSYDWSVNGTGWTGSSTTNSISLTAGTGPLTISVGGVNGCGSGPSYSLPNSLTVIASPLADFGVSTHTTGIGQNVTVTFSGTAPAGSTYTWTFDGGIATPGTGAGPQTVDWSTAGTETIILTVDNGGCTSTYTDTVQVDKSTAGINSTPAPAIEGVSIVPNPAFAQITITISTSIEATGTVSIYDMSGRVVANIYNGVIREGQTNISFDAEGIAAGIYMVKATDGNTIITKRFIKMN